MNKPKNPIINELVDVINYLSVKIDEPNCPGTTLDSNCYHLEESLVKESLNLIYRNIGDVDSKRIVSYFLKNEDVSKAAYGRIKELINMVDY